MSFWSMLAIQVVTTAVVVVAILSGFWFGVVRPYLNRRVAEIIEAADAVEPKVTRGVKKGVSEALVEFPELGVKESTRQFIKFGSGLFENGLSSFLGSAADLNRRNGDAAPPGPDTGAPR